MKSSHLKIASWLLLFLAIAAWIGVVLFAQEIQNEMHDREVHIENTNQASARQSAAARIRALISETQAERAALDKIAKSDILTEVKMIESAGTPAGVKLHISDALPEGVRGSSDLHAIIFVIEGDGTFSALMQTLALLESLPLPTSITQMDISRSPTDLSKPEKGNVSWHMSLRLRLLTAAGISS